MNQLTSFQLSEGLPVHFHPIGFSKTKEATSLEYIKKMGLPEHLVDKVCITGQQGDLVMLQLMDNFIPSPDAGQEKMSDFQNLNQIRGWVFNIRTMTLLAKSICEDRVVLGPVERLKIFHDHGFSCSPFLEGTVIRFLYDGSKWISLTQRRIDATNTKIPETDIKILKVMKEACPGFNTDLLDPKLVYVFMIVDPQNQIMNPSAVEESVYFLGNLLNGSNTNFDPKVVALEGMRTMDTIDIQAASTIVQNQGWILLSRGNEIIRYGLPQLSHLLRVRYLNGNPHFTAAYLYLATAPQDQKYLPYAVPHAMKPYVEEPFMHQWCKSKGEALIEFLVMCKIAFSGGLTFKLNYDLRKLCMESAATPNYTGDRVVLEIFYSKMIWALLNEKPLEFYKMCKAMDVFNNNFHKTNLVKFVQPDGAVFMPKNPQFCLPVPNFAQEPTPKEASQKKSKKRAEKPKQNIKKLHRETKRPTKRTPVSMADLLQNLNINE